MARQKGDRPKVLCTEMYGSWIAIRSVDVSLASLDIRYDAVNCLFRFCCKTLIVFFAYLCRCVLELSNSMLDNILFPRQIV